MAGTPDVEDFWSEFCRLHGVASGERHDAFAFGDDPGMQDELLALVLHGPKRATAMLLLEHEVGATRCRPKAATASSWTAPAGRAA